MSAPNSIRRFHRVGLIRSDTASEYQIEFWRRYLELVFAQLFNARPPEGLWCASGEKDFKRSIAAGSGHPGSMYLADSSARHLLDEAAWHCARLLNTLYETAPFDLSRDSPSLVPVSDDRYWLMAAFANGVRHDAIGIFSVATWDSVLRTLLDMVWVDFLAWCLGRTNLPTPARDVVPPAVAAFCARSAAPDQVADDAWFDAELPADLRAALAQPLRMLSLLDFDDLMRAVLLRYPNERVRKLAPHRQVRAGIVEQALDMALDGLVEFELDEWASHYFDEAVSRAGVESRETHELLDLLVEREYEVAIALHGTLPQPLVARDHGLEITSRAPETRSRSSREKTVYAYVRGLHARGPEEAIAKAQRSVQLCLAAPAVRFGLGIQIQPNVGTYFRRVGSTDWWPSGGGHGLPLTAIVEHWETTLETWRDLLCATDPLAIRIHEAIVSLNKGSSSSNPADRLQAHWRVFEIIVGRQANLRSQGWLLPLYFIHKSFESLPGPEKRTFVDDRCEVLRRQFKALIDFRDKAIDHRETVRPDGAVLHHWAATGETLAREVLSAAIVGWYRGARSSDALYRILRAAYDRRGVPLL